VSDLGLCSKWGCSSPTLPGDTACRNHRVGPAPNWVEPPRDAIPPPPRWPEEAHAEGPVLPAAPRKDDQGKDRMSLLPWKALRLAAKVLTFGAQKYGSNNWQGVSTERYEDALLRHYEAWRGGERNDQESGLPHLAHAACCVLFILAQTEGLDGTRGSVGIVQSTIKVEAS